MTPVIFYSALTLAIFGHAALAADWSYNGLDGPPPERWDEIDQTCNGQQQSPIIVYEGDLSGHIINEAFSYVNYDTTLTGMTMSNNGHTVTVNLPDQGLTLSGGDLPNGDTFVPIQFHMHWGSVDGQGSEHLVNEQAFPMELHIVHKNTKYTEVADALANYDGAAVLGFMYEFSSDDNAAYNDIVTQLSNILNKDDETNIADATLNSFLPDSFNNFYRYNGSLTTPNCQEAVTWTLFTDSIKISQAQLDAFRLLKDVGDGYMVDNYRPTQPINMRDVVANFDPDLHWHYDGDDLGPEKWQHYYEECGSNHQSPIDIDDQFAEKNDALTDFVYTGYDQANVGMKLKNNGHTVQVDITASPTITINGGGLPENFVLAQFHLHWGANDNKGSEHHLNHEEFPAEVHFVHYKESLGSLGNSAFTEGGLAVLGFFFEVVDTPNANWNKIIEKLSLVEQPNSDTDIDSSALTLVDLLPVNPMNYYRYEGSLTTPGCYESVTWTVFEEKIPISSTQLAAFRTLLSKEKDASNNYIPITFNYRPVQKLASRLITRNFVPDTGKHWSYVGSTGVDSWATNYAACAGSNQSPVDIVPTEVELNYQGLPEFAFNNYANNQGIEWELINNGHTVQVNVDLQDFYTLTGGGLTGTYHMIQFHFHWGSTNTRGSEHLIDSIAYPMELHLVHVNDAYTNASMALANSDGAAVLGFMFEVTGTDNPYLAPVVSKLTDITNPYTQVDMDPLDVANIMPATEDLTEYYRYQGSLTTPTCNEAVTWTVFRKTIPISETQLQAFRSLLSADKDAETSDYTPMVDNYRPVQSLNTRRVQANFIIGKASGVHTAQWVSVLAGLFAAFAFGTARKV